jgi:deoxyribodipyrimidine photolyase-related protein
MGQLRVIFPDQLSRDLSALEGIDPAHDLILLAETRAEFSAVPHHRQKLAMIFAAMRHFAQTLRAEGLPLRYITLEDPANSGNLHAEILRACAEQGLQRVCATEPGQWSQWHMLQSLAPQLALELRPDQRFLCSRAEFEAWAHGRKQLRMEYFYRQMRQRTGWLMDGSQPLGGSWNFDRENRKPLPRELDLPERLRFAPDALTREVIAMVERQFGQHFGSLAGFGWPVTRTQALQALEHFIAVCLPDFGDYQDAMRAGADFVFHALLAPALNLGLLKARELCEAAVAAEHAPLAAREGFVRQILGWREYVRGIYWLYPDYADSNFLAAERPLPAFYWSGETDLNCLRQCVDATRRNAYAHHIQRLMITGNFALLAGLRPAEVEAWYLAVYADAWEWVELPNTHGMALFADGGLMASKPYAASGAYIQRMSDYCRDCRYDPQLKQGPRACPFNYLYWDFLLRQRERLSGNPRLAMPYRNLARFDADRIAQIEADAATFLAGCVLPAAADGQ